MIAIFKHELHSYFHSLTAYVFGAFLLVFVGIGAMMYNLEMAVSNFEYVLGFSSIIFVIIVPILTMRTLAEERRQKTDQLLYSLPISTVDVIIGKYLALLVVFMVPLLLILIYPYIFSSFGEVYLLTSYATILAFFVMGAALIAIGMFLSSLTENQGLAAGLGVVVVLFNYYSVSLSEYVSATALGSYIVLAVTIVLLGILIKYLTKSDKIGYSIASCLLIIMSMVYFINQTIFEGLVPEIMSTLSLFERFYTFVNGVFDITAIVYYLSIIAFFIFLSVQALEKRRYN